MFYVKYQAFSLLKTVESAFIDCNQKFLDYVGCKRMSQIEGDTDFDCPWLEHAQLYRQHEIDALNGKIYSAIHPGCAKDGREVLFFNSKYPHCDAQGKVIGILGHALEIVNPQLLQLHSLIQQAPLPDCKNHTLASNAEKFNITVRQEECLFFYYVAILLNKLLDA